MHAPARKSSSSAACSEASGSRSPVRMGSRSSELDKGSVRDVALDPQWLPHTYDSGGSLLTSVFVPRERHQELMFLSDEHFENRFPKVTNPAAGIAAESASAAQAPIHFIFHTAF